MNIDKPSSLNATDERVKEDQLEVLPSEVSAFEEAQPDNEAFQAELVMLRTVTEVLMAGPDPIVIEDLTGRVVKINDEAERFYGWQRQELIGQPVKTLLPPQEHQLADDLRDRCCQGEQIRNVEGLHWNKQQDQYPVLLTLLLLTDEQGVPIGMVNLIKNLTQQKQLEAALREREERLQLIEAEREWFFEKIQERVEQTRRLASALTLAEQRERNRISRILYDDLQQLLFGLLIRLELLDFRFSTSELSEFKDQFDQIIQSISQVIDTTRTLVIELAPPVLESEGIEEALHWLISHMEESYQLQVYLSIEDQGQLHHSDIQTLLLQVVRELLINVIKHAGTHQAHLNLRQEEGFLTIQIKDEGQGFDVGQVRDRQMKQKSSGLFKVESWLDLMGGRLEIDSTPGRGTQITIVAPVAKTDP